MNKPHADREFTGRHMLLVMVAFFGVIITVNVTMAVLATRSWTGLVVGHTYVASQEFNERTERGRAQMALGWQPALTVAPRAFGRWRLRCGYHLGRWFLDRRSRGRGRT